MAGLPYDLCFFVGSELGLDSCVGWSEVSASVAAQDCCVGCSEVRTSAFAQEPRSCL